MSPRQRIRNIAYSLSFTGTNKVVSANNVGISGTDPWSMGGWVKFPNFNESSPTAFRFPFGMTATGYPFVGAVFGNFGSGSNGVADDVSTIKLNGYTDKWVHLSGTYSGGAAGTYSSYINGVLVFSDVANTVPVIADAKFAINDTSGSSTYQLPGNYADVFLADVELTQPQIEGLYTGVAPPALAVYWEFTEGSGTIVADSSGNANTGTITGATWSLDTPVRLRSQLLNRDYSTAIQYSSADSTRSSIPYANIGTSITYNAWIKPQNFTGPLAASSQIMDVVAFMQTLLRVKPTGIEWYPNTEGGTNSFPAFIPPNGFMISISQTSGNVVNAYINGLFVGTAGPAGVGSVNTANTYASNQFGYHTAAPQPFSGIIDEGQIWSRVLTPTELRDMYLTGTVSTTNLERYYKWNEGSGTTATDFSGNAQDGTITNGTYVQSFVKPRVAAAGRTQPSGRVQV